MNSTRLVLFLGLAVGLLGLVRPALSQTQIQKFADGVQKAPSPEPPREPLQQGGYQAPPPTGALQGPTRELGLSGGEIELPAIRLRLPRVRFPAFSMFVTPPQMQIEGGTAPLVQNVQEQVSVPSGEREALTEPDREPVRAFDQQPVQKTSYHLSDTTLGTLKEPPPESSQLARMRVDMLRFQSQMEERLARLTESVERLAAETRDGAVGANPSPQVNPHAERNHPRPIRPASYGVESP